MILQILLIVGIVLTGINGFMIGRQWERAHGVYRQRYEFLSETISGWAKMIELKEEMEQQPILSPVQADDL